MLFPVALPCNELPARPEFEQAVEGYLRASISETRATYLRLGLILRVMNSRAL